MHTVVWLDDDRGGMAAQGASLYKDFGSGSDKDSDAPIRLHFSGACYGGNTPTLFDSQQETLEMWVRVASPLKTPLRFGPEPQYVLFCQSPLRYDHSLLDNTRSVCLRRLGDRMIGRVSTKEFQSVWAGASLADWTEAGWHHVAMQWSAARQDQLTMEIFLDGRCVSRELSTNLHERVWHKKAEGLVVQLGSMVSGAGALGWPLDEVRVSSARRYPGDFVPAKRAARDGRVPPRRRSIRRDKGREALPHWRPGSLTDLCVFGVNVSRFGG